MPLYSLIFLLFHSRILHCTTLYCEDFERLEWVLHKVHHPGWNPLFLEPNAHGQQQASQRLQKSGERQRKN